MRTPAGIECKFYYEDYFRGRDVQECRCAKHPDSQPWNVKLCEKCPVPSILRANASPNLELELNIKSTILGFGRKMTVEGYCRVHEIPVDDPHTGCPRCNAERPGLDLFSKALNDDSE